MKVSKWLAAHGLTLVCACGFIVLFGLSLAVMFSEGAHKSISALVGVREKYDLLKFLGICMGGVLLCWQALLSHKRARMMEDAAQAQAAATKAQARSIEATEQGQRQERLKNAIEHLGHESVSVRLGGAYELFHLAEDTEALRKTALDILCVHIRRTTGEDGYQAKYNAKPSDEVQSLLTLLFVQDHQVFKGLQANLQGSFLNGADLNKAHLRGANLWGAHLRGAVVVYGTPARGYFDGGTPARG
ncbi:MAG: pentapeptide repeat-containing protein [Nitrospira sp.]|nr:pentapeptide repeat-containing protein [Nitrospira sp.]